LVNTWELDHVGIVVNDIEKAIQHFRKIRLEVGVPAQEQTWQYFKDGLTGHAGNLKYKTCFMQNEAIRLELIQPIEKGSIFTKFLADRGEGVNHMAFRVNNFEEEKARLASQGTPVLARLKRPDGSEMELYFDEQRFGNVIIALFNGTGSFPTFRPVEAEWQFHHVGLIVKNVDAVAGIYQSLGFEPIAPIKEPVFAENSQQWEIFGKHPEKAYKIRWTQMQNKSGSFIIEITQPVEGESLMMSYAQKHGEGLNHIHIKVKDLVKEKAVMESQGFPVIMSVKNPAGKLFETFYDTARIGGVYFALWCGPGPFNAKKIV
jgi:methylmalonyl-CoA/ethylmalonyl-CoA epimerase